MPWSDKNQRKAEQRHAEYRWCPYLHCTFGGSEEEVDEHRATGVHNDEPQAGSNLKHRPRT